MCELKDCTVCGSAGRADTPSTACECGRSDLRKMLSCALDLQKTVQGLCDEIAFLRMQGQSRHAA